MERSNWMDKGQETDKEQVTAQDCNPRIRHLTEKDLTNFDKDELIKKLMGKETIYAVPYGKTLKIEQGDFVMAGDRLTEGPLDPHKIFQIKGLRETGKIYT